MKPKTITQILEDWLEDANSTSMMGVTIDDERTDADRDKQYQDYLAEALAQIQQLLEECAPEMRTDTRGATQNPDNQKYLTKAAMAHNQAISQYKSNLRGKIK